MFIVTKAHVTTLTFNANFLPEKEELIPTPFESVISASFGKSILCLMSFQFNAVCRMPLVYSQVTYRQLR